MRPSRDGTFVDGHVQQVGKSFDDYLVSLRELVKTCNFCNNDCLRKAIRDQIIEGLLDGEIIQELLQVKDLTLDQAITKCRGLEAAKKSRQDIQGTSDFNTFQTHPLTTRSGTCPGCGNPFHEGGCKKCPAFNQTCRNCGRSGHFARVCSRKRSTAGQYRKPATPHAHALSMNELPVVQLSELAHRPTTPAPTVYPPAMDKLPSTSYQTQGQILVRQGPNLSKHLGSTWITWPPPTSVPGLSMAPSYTQSGSSHMLPSVSMAEQFMMMSTSMTRSQAH